LTATTWGGFAAPFSIVGGSFNLCEHQAFNKARSMPAPHEQIIRAGEPYPSHRVKVLVDDDRRHHPIVLRPDGVPALLPCLWIDGELRGRNRQVSTIRSYAGTLCLSENWFALHGLDPVGILREQVPFEDWHVDNLRDYLHLLTPTGKAIRSYAIAKEKALVEAGRRKPGEGPIRLLPDVVSLPVLNTRLLVVATYLRWLNRKLTALLFPSLASRRTAVPVLAHFADSLAARRVKTTERRREGLSERTAMRLLAAILPSVDHSSGTACVFGHDVRHRNFALMLLLASTGLRMGEALGLKLCDLTLDGAELRVSVVRRPDDPDEERRVPPQTKTQERTLPLPTIAAVAILDWIDVHRTDSGRFGDATGNHFLFLARLPKGNEKRRADALSLGGADKIFRTLRERLGSSVEHLTAHRLRHTWMDHVWSSLRAAGPQDPFVLDVINYAGGWRAGSRQAQAYARRAVREASDEFSRIFQDALTRGLK
jgi:integrase